MSYKDPTCMSDAAQVVNDVIIPRIRLFTCLVNQTYTYDAQNSDSSLYINP